LVEVVAAGATAASLTYDTSVYYIASLLGGEESSR
jgi:hypothetical protein